jgi:membrane protein
MLQERMGAAANASKKPKRAPVPTRGWARRGWTFVWNASQRLSDHNTSVLAAAVAFYSFLSIFPAITALVSLYGLVANPHDVERQIGALQAVLPAEAISPIASWLHSLAQKPPGHFSLGFAISTAIAVWTAGYATGTLMTALDLAYDVAEQRSFFRFYAVALLLTTLLILFVGSAIFLIALLPALIGFLPMPPDWQNTALWVRWPILLVLVVLAVALLYRYAPNRADSRCDIASAGALVATGGLIAGSYGFSVYINAFAAYDRTYGSLGAVAVLLTWLWIAGYSVLAGAELNAEIGTQHRREAEDR